ncbi:MAG: hypothetical protein KA004_18355 [Verrucomicrobiales bacterium]|nr:hypothetical protein [Verrucomicrobiales bacterium]
MKIAFYFSLIVNVVAICVIAINHSKTPPVTRIDDLNVHGRLYGALDLPLGTITTIDCIPAKSQEFLGQETILRVRAINGTTITNEISIPATAWDGLRLDESYGKVLRCKGYERIEEIGYSRQHWELVRERVEMDMKQGKRFDPAMVSVEHRIRTLFLVITAEEIESPQATKEK